ncbi:MAG: hypothetical protein JTT11_07220, partial [Candidatus Brockarchaeota archaeon]|nr:hypothetical protein [Candidatus Brockarchaeota archaeon]
MEAITLAKDGKTDYNIVVSSSCSASERHAAVELKIFLNAISSADFNLVDDKEKETESEILVGESGRFADLRLGMDLPRLGEEGFAIKTRGRRLVIAGGRRRGTMYGTYTFLEKYLGCRWFSSKVSKIPKMR